MKIVWRCRRAGQMDLQQYLVHKFRVVKFFSLEKCKHDFISFFNGYLIT